MTKTVAIMYGFTEGQWHGKHFRRLLRERGYKVIKNASEANVVIAHSAGCFYLPELAKQQQLILIDPPYWPEKSLSSRSRNMITQMALAVRPGNQPFYHVHKTAHNLAYLARHARTNREMLQMAPNFNLEAVILHCNTTLVHNSNDPWLTPYLGGLKQINSKLRIMHIPGDHDDLWLHPEPYIKLINRKI